MKFKTKQEVKDAIAKQRGAESWYQLNRDRQGNCDLLPTKFDIEQAMEDYAEQFKNPINSINELVKICYDASFKAGWHTDINTGELKERNKGEMLCLIHSEISEAMEGERKKLMDDHLRHRPMAEVELADAVIRICDYAGRWGYDLGGAIMEKLEYNSKRADHKIENRLTENGKKF